MIMKSIIFLISSFYPKHFQSKAINEKLSPLKNLKVVETILERRVFLGINEKKQKT